MASSKERQRWERWYDDVNARMDRQAKSIGRLVAINTELMAAVLEIADAQSGYDLEAQERAQKALDRIKEAAATNPADEAQLAEDEATEPTDPRSNRG